MTERCKSILVLMWDAARCRAIDGVSLAAIDTATRREAPMPDTKPAKPDYPPIRRIVTGHEAGGIAKVLIDAPATNWKSGSPGTVSTLVWSTDSTPADIAVGEPIEDCGARVLGTAPPAKGTRFAVIDFPPGNSGRMHRTETIDYVIVISGEIDMDMDDSTVHLKAGDVMVQRGTNHAWVNRGRERARVAFVLIDASPLGIGHPVVGGASPR
jgi:quercetin dioxygenase-like cupin family protein